MNSTATAPHARTADARPRRYWINTVCRDHVHGAAEGGFIQSNHGSATRLRQTRPGDEVIFYSPRTSLKGGEPLQQFTAAATITGQQPYQVTISNTFAPWRLTAQFHPAQPAAAKPLITDLSFIIDPSRWGLPFRRGLFTVPEVDFTTVASAMGWTPTPAGGGLP